MTDTDIENIILQAVRNMNMARMPDSQVDASPTAPLFGPDSPLDSLGLVSLLLDVEEGLADKGVTVTISDSRAMSQRHSPFRNVPALVAYIRDVMVSPS